MHLVPAELQPPLPPGYTTPTFTNEFKTTTTTTTEAPVHYHTNPSPEQLPPPSTAPPIQSDQGVPPLHEDPLTAGQYPPKPPPVQSKANDTLVPISLEDFGLSLAKLAAIIVVVSLVVLVCIAAVVWFFCLRGK